MENNDSQVSVPEMAVNTLYNNLKDIIGNGKISVANITSITINLMQIVDKYKNVKGLEKKKIVLDVLNRIVDDTIDDKAEEQQLKLLLAISVPVLIDTFIAIDKGELAIKTKKAVIKLFTCCK
jgi:hypothetical protein